MDPKYTEIEEHVRKKWKARAQEAQENLFKLKGEAVEREKRERAARVEIDRKAEEARKEAARKSIQAQGLVEAVIEELGKLERTHGVKPVSWYSSTIATNGQQTITVQLSKIGEPRNFSSRW